MNRRASQVVAALAAAGFTAALASAAHAGPEFTRAAAGRYALVGGTVHTVTKGDVENGTVLVDGGRITAVGTGLAVPADATVIDCKGKQVYPGFIAANTQLGLIEIETIEGANDTQETGNINPNIRAEVMFNPDSDLLPVTRLNGVTSALVVPGGGAIHGTSALMHLDGWTAEDMTVRAPVGLHVDWPGAQSVRQFGPGPSAPDADALKAQAAAVQAIRDAFGDARAYEKARAAEAAKGSPRHDADARWDAMRKAVSGEVPVFFHANSARQIRGVLDFVDEQGLAGAVLVGGRDAWRFADDLKARGQRALLHLGRRRKRRRGQRAQPAVPRRHGGGVRPGARRGAQERDDLPGPDSWRGRPPGIDRGRQGRRSAGDRRRSARGRDALRARVHRRPPHSHGEPADAALPEVRFASARSARTPPLNPEEAQC